MTRRLTLPAALLFIIFALGAWWQTTHPPDASEANDPTTDATRVVGPVFSPTGVTDFPDGVPLGPEDRDPELIVLTDLTPEPPAEPVRMGPKPTTRSAVENGVEEEASPEEADEEAAPQKRTRRIKRSGTASVRIDASLDTARGGARIQTVSVGARPSRGVGLSIGTGGDPVCRPTHAGPTFINRRGVRSLSTGLSAPRY